MSDLQCAAMIALVAERRTPDVVGLLLERRVTLVYASETTTAAGRLAEALGTGMRDLPAVPAVEGAAAQRPDRPVTELLEELADEHRGECVVLVVADDALRRWLAALPAAVDGPWREGDDAVTVELDSDGWRVSVLSTAR